MESLPEIPDVPASKQPALRPAALSMLSGIAGIFTGTLTLLFLSGLAFSGRIQRVSDLYLSSSFEAIPNIKLVFIAGFITHSTALAGIVLIYKLKKTGFYMLTLSFTAIIAGSYLFPAAALVSPLIYLVFLILFTFYLHRLG